MLQECQPSTRQLLDSSQAIVSSYVSDAFGNNISSSGSAANPFRWNGSSGYYSDAESGLQKVGARYYDPSVGGWISQDTMLLAGSPADSQAVNRYLYCGADPVGRVDPGGHEVPPWVAGAGALLFVAVVVYMLEFHDFFELRGPVTGIGNGYVNRIHDAEGSGGDVTWVGVTHNAEQQKYDRAQVAFYIHASCMSVRR